MKLRHLSALVACTVLLLAVPTSSAANVQTDYKHGTDFSQFHSYCWGRVQANNQLVAQRITKAVDILLQQKGWHESQNNCQITVFALAHVHNQKQAQTIYDGFGGGWGMGWGWGGWGWGPGGGFGESNTTTYNQPVGHMVVDMFDTRNKQLLWRGISSADLSNSPGKNRKQLYKDIHEMFQHFPPKGNG